MASLSSEYSRKVKKSLSIKFHPPRLFKFPKRKFGMKGEAVQSFRVEWCSDANYPWLHYDVSSDSPFCYLCMSAAHKGKLLASSKKDAAFLSKGYSYWKEVTTAFKEHQAS